MSRQLPALGAAAALVLALASPAGAAHVTARPVDRACPASAVSTSAENGFTDVGQDFFELPINCLADLGTTRGSTATTYAPDGTVTRRQMALFLYRLAKAAGVAFDVSDAGFRDLDAVGPEARSAIDGLANARVTGGVAPGRFDPDGLVTRGQMASFLDRLHGLVTGSRHPGGPDAFDDDEGSVHEAAIDAVAAAGIATGTADGDRSFVPAAPVSRRQMAGFLAREADVLVEAGRLAPPADDTEPGDLDRTFGVRGLVVQEVGEGYSEAEDVALAPDGGVVSVGVAERAFGVLRLTADGVPDASFSGDGEVVTPFGGPGTFALATGVAVQPDGRPVAVGFANLDPATVDADLALARYDLDGTLDETFGGDGRVTTSLPSYAYATDVALDAQERIVVTGGVESADATGTDVVVARYLPDGTLDASFGDGGVVVVDVAGGLDVASALALLPDGSVVVGGTSGRAGEANESSQRPALLRLLPDGTADAGFGTDGVVELPADGPFARVDGLAVDADGRYLLTGLVYDAERTSPRIWVARVLPDGARDASFADDGTTTTQAAVLSEAADVVAQPDGRVVVAGRVADSASSSDPAWDWVLVRYAEDGRLDPSFGTGGVRRLAAGKQANAAVLDGDRLVVAGCDCPFPAYGRGGMQSESSFVVGRFLLEPLAPARRP